VVEGKMVRPGARGRAEIEDSEFEIQDRGIKTRIEGFEMKIQTGNRGINAGREPKCRVRVSWCGISSKLFKTRQLNEIQLLSHLFSIT